MTMQRIPERSRLPVLVGMSVLALLLVAGGVIVVPRLVPGTPNPWPSSSVPASPTLDPSTPDGIVRAFFSAFSRARRTNDATLVLPFVTGEASDAYRSVKGFLDGQRDVGKASVIQVEKIENLQSEETGETASVAFDFTEGGYDISLDTGEPIESPTVLPTRRVTVGLKQVDGRWLVDDYEST